METFFIAYQYVTPNGNKKIESTTYTGRYPTNLSSVIQMKFDIEQKAGITDVIIISFSRFDP